MGHKFGYYSLDLPLEEVPIEQTHFGQIIAEKLTVK